jgi:hypothetical protein
MFPFCSLRPVRHRRPESKDDYSADSKGVDRHSHAPVSADLTPLKPGLGLVLGRAGRDVGLGRVAAYRAAARGRTG